LAAGVIARTFAKGLASSNTGKLLAVGSRSQASADRLGDEFDVSRRYGSYEALLADEDVDAVYISTPHPHHAEWAIKAAEAGKHILCEKPLALNHAQAMAMVEAARANDVFLMEAFMYRCHPQTRKLVELLRERVIGEVRLIQANFGFHAPFNAAGRLFSNELAGGGILDVGCYPISMTRLVAGAAMGKDFADPAEVKGAGHLGRTGVDEWAAAVLKFPGGIVAQIATGVSVDLDNVVRIFGSEGEILVPEPWMPSREGGAVKIIVNRKGESPREIVVETSRHLYSFEADVVAENIARRQAPSPAMSWDDSLGNMLALDEWRQSIGLTYEQEKPENVKTITRRPLAVRTSHSMTYSRIAGVNKPISRLVMGMDNITFAPHLAVLFDDFFEHGGNCWDTAYMYGNGKCEPALGAWIKSRGLREQIVLLDKGAHTPFCTPFDLTRQFKESLERLQTDYVDMYMLHRDNTDVPVGEFIDVLNEHHRAGQMKVFGCSNWSIARFEAANAYAKSKALQGFSAISNNFSLARMVNPPWSGCVAASDPESRAWLTKTQTPLLSWSSQARRFFVPGVADPNNRADGEMVWTWYCDDNFQRLARANELAKKKGVEAIHIALAYVLHQPFPTWALIGPRQLSELRSSLRGLEVELSAKDVAWLNLES
jgi:predicted dehydrogenase/aryl-alcohol dehydrogenase-like predicted oxidoreductase